MKASPAKGQNKHILSGYRAVNDVLIALVHLNIAVESILIEGRQPVIKLIKPPREGKLNGCSAGIIYDGFGRQEKFTHVIDNCRIEWLQDCL